MPPGGFVFSLPFIVCKFSPTGSGETITDSNLTRAHGTPLNSWWSDHISDGSGGYFQFCFSCGPPSGASHGFASMATMHNFRGPGLGADFAQNYNFDLLTCSPFLATGEFDPSTSQKWAASG